MSQRHDQSIKEAALLARSDELALRSEYLFDVPAWLRCHLVARLNNPADLPAGMLILNICLTLLPLKAAAALLCRSHALCAILFAASYALYMQRFVLTLHVTEHRPLFKPGNTVLNGMTPYVLCVLFGIPSACYRPHHVVMHHVEDNRHLEDLSSTEPYQRDNLLHFICYWLRHCLASSVELPLYILRKGRLALAASGIIGWLGFCYMAACLWYINPVGALWTFVIPYVVSSLLLMFGNWSQHIFVVPGGASNAYGMTYNCVFCPDNSRTYNDGYHVVHHLNSQLHWSKMPQQFMQTISTYDEADGLVFKGIGFFDVGLAVFSGRLGWLADRVVPCGPRQAARSREDWVHLLRERLKPVVRRKAL